MGRTIQNTTLTVGLLSVPVALRKITSKTDVKIDRASKAGNKIERKEFDSVTGELIGGADDVQHGKWDGDEFRPIPQDALDAIEAETKIEEFVVEHFIPLKDLPVERITDAYYLAPQRDVGSGKPLKLLYEALKRSKRAGVFKLTLTKRQYLAAIYAHNGGLVVNLLAFSSDFKQSHEADAAIAKAEVKPAEVALAVELIEANAADADVIDTFEDDLVTLRQQLVDEALAGRKIPAKKKEPSRPKGDALMDSLRESVEAAQRKKVSKSAASKRQGAAV